MSDLTPSDEAILAVLTDCTTQEGNAGYEWISVPDLIGETLGSLALLTTGPEAVALQALVNHRNRYGRVRSVVRRLERAGLAESRRDAGRVEYRASPKSSPHSPVEEASTVQSHEGANP